MGSPSRDEVEVAPSRWEGEAMLCLPKSGYGSELLPGRSSRLGAVKVLWSELDDALLAGRSSNGLWCLPGDRTVARKDPRLHSGYRCGIGKLRRWPEIFERLVPNECRVVHAEITRHQIEPAVNDP